MKYILEFDNKSEFEAAYMGGAAFYALNEIDRKCKSHLKHGQECDLNDKFIEEIRDLIYEDNLMGYFN